MPGMVPPELPKNTSIKAFDSNVEDNEMETNGRVVKTRF